ncbi:MAG TPA: hypothetical protein VMJ65_10055 [Solirubrobacteraceae bacterium]|nr:hypothetical protein [Solirubrobacteraceae bacterium]
MFALLQNHATGMPTLDAEADFRRARRRHAAARVGRWVTRRSDWRHPRTLDDPAVRLGGLPRMQVVPLAAIVGTLEPTLHFDACFRPASNLVRRRWERIALAHRRGVALPPIELIKRPDGYYVLDGRHRVSVARALGHPDIDARVTGARPQP